MTLEEARELCPGDRVFWMDPADCAWKKKKLYWINSEDSCSKSITINYIKVNGEVVFICGHDDSELECYAHELLLLHKSIGNNCG
jgi:hypothetical protein